MSPTALRFRRTPKLALLDQFEATLTGRSDQIEAALPLRDALAARKLSPCHALDLLRAFRMDAVKRRYATWSELMDYCAYSAAPVGRFVLDVHGESESTWPASDALCTALQVINHLQDCAADYRNLDRVYVPLDALAAQGIGVEALAATKASPALRAVLHAVAARERAAGRAGRWSPGAGLRFPPVPGNRRDRGARPQAQCLLRERDPLSENVHLTKAGLSPGRASGSPMGCGHFSGRGRSRRLRRRRMTGASAEAAPADAAAARARGSSFNAAMRILPRPQPRGDV